MAATHVTTGFNPQQSSRTTLRLKPEHREAFLGYEDISGVSAQKLLDRALEEYIQCVLVAKAEGLLMAAKKRQRAEKRAARKREVDDCLAALERDLSA